MILFGDINKRLYADLNYEKVDQFMLKILLWHLGVYSVVAFVNSYLKLAQHYPSPLSWRVISTTEVLVSFSIAVFITVVPLLLRGKFSNHFIWRVIVTFALTIYSYLFVFISGGAIEMHFHFFIIAALLIVYADWRLGWIVLILTALHHGILDQLAPGWVYYYGENLLAVIAHAVPLLVTVFFTTIISINARQTVLTLKDAEERLDKLKMKADLDALHTALDKVALFSATDGKGNIYYANEKFVDISKFTLDELMGQNHRILKSGYHTSDFYSNLWRTIKSGEVWSGEIKNKAKDGSFYWVAATIVPIMGADGRPERYISIRFPITERKVAEEELVSKNSELQKINTFMIDRELAMIELKNKVAELTKKIEELET